MAEAPLKRQRHRPPSPSHSEAQRCSLEKRLPLVDLDASSRAAELVGALRDSGFLLVRSAALPQMLKQRALAASATLLGEDPVEVHPSDPKRYRMLRRKDLKILASGDPAKGTSTLMGARATLVEFWTALEKIKFEILRLLAEGLGLESSFFTERHATDNDSLRLLHYPPAPGSGNRCKEHSDYGSLTLLCTDAAAGLEFWSEDKESWLPVPTEVEDGDERAVLVVNAGSLLSSWTRGDIRATLHRVAGPASLRSATPRALLEHAAARDRYSVAFFADPDPGVHLSEVAGGTEAVPPGVRTVADYVRWRCGLDGEGVSYAPGEAPLAR